MKTKIGKWDTEIDVKFMRGLAVGYFEQPLHIKDDDGKVEWSSVSCYLLLLFFSITWSRIYFDKDQIK